MKPLGKLYFVLMLIWLAAFAIANWNASAEVIARGIGGWAGVAIPLGLLVFFGRRKGTK